MNIVFSVTLVQEAVLGLFQRILATYKNSHLRGLPFCCDELHWHLFPNCSGFRNIWRQLHDPSQPDTRCRSIYSSFQVMMIVMINVHIIIYRCKCLQVRVNSKNSLLAAMIMRTRRGSWLSRLLLMMLLPWFSFVQQCPSITIRIFVIFISIY